MRRSSSAGSSVGATQPGVAEPELSEAEFALNAQSKPPRGVVNQAQFALQRHLVLRVQELRPQLERLHQLKRPQ